MSLLREVVLVKFKKVLVFIMSCAFLICSMAPAEAGFGLGDLTKKATKVVNHEKDKVKDKAKKKVVDEVKKNIKIDTSEFDLDK